MYCKYGGKRKEKPVYNGIQFDSSEEIEFYYWLEEAKEFGYVDEFWFHSDVYDLIPEQFYYGDKHTKKKGWHKADIKLQPCRYELDFKVFFKPKFIDTFVTGLHIDELRFAYIDTKGGFKRAESVFSIKRKLMLQSNNIVVSRVEPIKFFELTWRPEKAGLTKVKKDIQKCYQHLKTYKELGL